MTDTSSQAPTMPPARAGGGGVSPRRRVPPRMAWGLAGLSGLAIGCYLWVTEGSLATMTFAGAVCLTAGALAVLATRRLLPAVVSVAALVALVVAATTLKSQEANMLLHAYDIVLALGSWATLGELVATWLDHNGWVRSISCQYRGMDKPDQPIRCRGVVKRKWEEGGKKLAQVEIWTENAEGQKTTPGEATVIFN